MNEKIIGDEFESARKAYEPPRLEVYGDLTSLTTAVDNTGGPDGGMGSMDKT